MKFLSLKYKLFALSVAAAMIMAVLASTISILQERHERESEARIHLQHIEGYHAGVIAKRLWILDYPYLQNAVTHLVVGEHLSYASVKDPRGTTLSSAGTSSGSKAIRRVVDLTYPHNGKNIKIGTLEVESAQPTLFMLVVERWQATFLMNVLFAVVLFGLFYFLYNRSVQNRINSLVDYAHRIDLTATSFPVPPTRIGEERFRDELSLLYQAFTDLVQRAVGEIGRRTEAEKSLDEQNSLLRAIYEGIPDVIVTADQDRKIVSVNRAMTTVFGYAEEELLGKKTAVLYASENAFHEQGKKRFNPNSPKSPDPYLVTYQRKDGSNFPGETLGVPISNVGGEVIGYIGIIRDVTKRIEEERRATQSQKLEAVGMLAGGVAHDFNNILSPIITYAQLLLNKLEKDSRSYEMVGAIHDSAIRAADLVKQILVFSRQSEANNGPIQIDAVVKEVFKLIRASIPSHIQIDTEIPAGIPMVLGDPTKIHQILMNLCTNSFHALGDTQGTITIKLESVYAAEVGAKKTSAVLLSVIDTGPGIAAEDIEKIFDPYYTTKETGVGTGLGLYIVKKIVDSMGGDVSVNSILGNGTQVSIRLPAVQDELQQEKPAAAEPLHGEGTILLVDDEESIVTAVKVFLEGLGYRVDCFTSSEDGLAQYLDNPGRYDLLITDLGMPKLSGLELSRRVRERQHDLPIILCSGRADLIDQQAVDELNIHTVLTKPDHVSRLPDAIHSALSARTSTAEP